MEDFEQKTDSMEEEKTTSSEISCAEEATENCIEMTVNQDNEPMTESSAEAEGIRNPEEEKPDSRGKKILVPLLSFFVPVLLFGLAWANNGITYGGNVTPLIYDMNAQYMPFIASLRYLLSGDYSILFNWNISLGGNYLALFAYYLASPLNWITVFWDIEDLPNAIYILTLLKIGLCGLNFSTYLKHGLSKGKTRWGFILFSSCYALMSYVIMYNMCLMWLDGIIMLPLILLGVERIINEKKYGVYIASIAALFLCNFYISYMVGIFTAVYFLCVIISKFERGKIRYYIGCSVGFAISTLLALGISMPLVLPALKSFSFGKKVALAGEGPTPVAYNYEFFELLRKFLPQQYDSLEGEGIPSIYCGLLVVLLVVIFFVQKHRLKEKIAAIILLASVFVGFLLPEADYFWHGFQFPHSYPYRYAFLFSAAMIIIAYKAYSRISCKYGLLVTVLSVYSFVELFLNASVLVSGLNEEIVYKVKLDYDIRTELYGTLYKDIRERDSTDFYRVGDNGGYNAVNYPIMYGVRGVQSFSSIFNAYSANFLTKYGGDGNYIITLSSGLTPFMNSVLGIRYIVSPIEMERAYTLLRSSRYEQTEFFLYENPHALTIGVLMDKFSNMDLGLEQENVFEEQNVLAQVLGYDEGQLFQRVQCDVEASDNVCEIRLSTENLINDCVYISFSNIVPSKGEQYTAIVDVLINGEKTDQICVGRFGENTLCILLPEGIDGACTVKLTSDIELTNLNDMELWTYNRKNYENFVMTLSKKTLQVIDVDNDGFSGIVTAKEDEVMFTTLPYDEGFSVKIDDAPIEYGGTMNAFICFEVPIGTHRIDVSYVPVGLSSGIVICIISIAGTFMFLLLSNKMKHVCP